jgi:hypothetical protein
MAERPDPAGKLPRKRFSRLRTPVFPTVQADELTAEGSPFCPHSAPSRNEEPPEEGDWTAEVEGNNQEGKGGDSDLDETQGGSPCV